MEYDSYIAEEISVKQFLDDKIWSIITSACDIGTGHIKRGELHQFIYKKLGFVGNCGNHFHKYMNKIITEKGHRKSWIHKNRIYIGLCWKNKSV